ncbi:MAG: signal peptide peptidase SppA [Candidatus Aminicenantes bacterium]|nr:signal peptide peptidase SppA [Candidatus Aminicenantes bacterium]NIM78427.1 signal peptide peptidase SppA [Candidatus Aminicenantes bacterium]NIN17689.1 signal peptide peptidase SppA [Candidatus Aminicenantes bacterium]NIN41565.1 signal peptide peptidase SppA [Candidatus Aminicenantes bacterium]NIN84339.1 signal peptide peptidase SppA [Candidatus Aminicenantes bacterium]
MKKGILITILVIVLLIVILALIGGYVYIQFTREPHIPENSYLQIDLIGPIVDIDNSVLPKKRSIRELWFHIKRAKVDKRIKGIILKISFAYGGFAKVEDIGRLIKDFKESGKKVYAFIEGGDIRSYYLSTFADKVYLFKGGYLILKGLASEAIFLKKTLSKLGIQGEFFHIGEYKTGANMFTEESMTPAHKEAIEKLLDDIYLATLEGIAVNRNLDVETVRKVIEEQPFSNQACLEAKLVDGILYEDEILENSEEKYVTLSFDTYRQTSSPLPYRGFKKIAVIFASGEIHLGQSGRRSIYGGEIMGSATVAKQLKSVRKNRYVKAVVLRIESPGGSGIASDVIRREVELAARKKPVVISMSDFTASGGYWIATPASKLMALPQTITGSIGVLGGKFVLKGLYDKIGLNKEIVKTSQYADMFSDYRMFSRDERDKIMELMKEMYRKFLNVVATSRNMDIEAVDKIGRGRVWTGSTALKLNLVDKLGGLNEAVEEAKKLAKIPPEEEIGIIIYPRRKTFFQRLMELMGEGSKISPTNLVLSFEEKINMYKTFFPAYLLPYKISIK